MNIKHIFSGEIFSSKRIVRRIPVLFVLFLVAVAYISAGYHMQHLKQRENNLERTYKELHATSVLIHQKMVKETSIENIQLLIKKYKLDYLNLQIEPTSPIEVKND